MVGYCSKDCQDNDRANHEHVCKEFPVIKGRNALHTAGPWNEHIASLRERAAQLPDAEAYALPIFRNPRVCNNCQESRIDLLTAANSAPKRTNYMMMMTVRVSNILRYNTLYGTTRNLQAV